MNQQQYHRKQTFEGEFGSLLRESGNTFDPATIFSPGQSDLSRFIGEEELEAVASHVRSNSPPSGPIYVEIHITDRCNSRCYFCNQTERRALRRELPVDVFEKVLVELRENGLKMVRLSGGGEPTLHAGIMRIIDLLGENRIILTRFDTNGMLLSRDLARKLIAVGVRTLHISLQAPERNAWAAATGLPPCKFELILRNIETFRDLDTAANVEVYASVAADETTIGLLDEALDLEERLGIQLLIHSLNSYRYRPSFSREVDRTLRRLINSPDRSKRAHQIADLMRIRSEVAPHRSEYPNPVIQTASREWSICTAPWTGALLKPDGTLMPCCAWQMPFGNVIEDGFRPVWRNANFQLFRREIHRAFFRTDRNKRHPLPDVGPGPCFSYCPIRETMFWHPAFQHIPVQTRRPAGK